MLITMPLPTITAVPNTTVCYLTAATLKAKGGISSGYRWTGPDNFTSLYQNAYVSSANSALPQTYTVVGTAANSCTNITTHTLYTWPLPIPTYTTASRVCFRSNIDLKAGGAASYTWSGPYNYLSPNRDVWFPTFDMRQAGIYTLSVIDTLGCKNTTAVAIAIDPLPVGKLVSNNADNYCAPYCSKFWLQYNSDASPITKTVWTIKSQTIEGTSFDYCAEKAGLHSVIGSFTNAVGCINTQSLPILANPRPEADFYFQPYKAIETVDMVSFKDLSKGDSLSNWNWYFADDLNHVGKEKNADYVFQQAGVQRVAMVVSNFWGCSDTVVKTIQVREDVHVYVPDAFTPNGDGLNDVFMPKGRGVKKYNLSIYNRWGDRIFESNDIAKGWDGAVGKSDSSDEVFVWRIIYTDVNFSVNELTGHVTLLR
jgi:gliding motility-associated-like protein